jgi:hypothetical protein
MDGPCAVQQFNPREKPDLQRLLHCCHTLQLCIPPQKLSPALLQNIDSLEHQAGLPRESVVAAHGNFDSARCIRCGLPHSVAHVRQAVFAGDGNPCFCTRKVPLAQQGVITPCIAGGWRGSRAALGVKFIRDSGALWVLAWGHPPPHNGMQTTEPVCTFNNYRKHHSTWLAGQPAWPAFSQQRQHHMKCSSPS